MTGTAHASGEAPGHLKIVVIGDSYTSGNGADPVTYRTVPVTWDDGSVHHIIDPALQSTTAPALQAIHQIQEQNPNVSLEVTFVAISGATRGSLYEPTRPGTIFEHTPQIDAANGADIVIVGMGGNDARFGDFAATVVTSRTSTTEEKFPEFMAPLEDGSYVEAQAALYADVAGRINPGGSIVTLGYPIVLPEDVPDDTNSPVSEFTISDREARLINHFAWSVHDRNAQATQLAAERTGGNFFYADLSTALAGHELFTPEEGLNGLEIFRPQTSYHPNALGQTLLANKMAPVVNQAVNHELARQGLIAPPTVDPIPLPAVTQGPTQNPVFMDQPVDSTPAEPAPSTPGNPIATEPAPTDSTSPGAITIEPIIITPEDEGELPFYEDPFSYDDPEYDDPNYNDFHLYYSDYDGGTWLAYDPYTTDEWYAYDGYGGDDSAYWDWYYEWEIMEDTDK